eukprot:2615180-Rhodomonas_salina.1
MRQWARREEDWARDLPPCLVEGSAIEVGRAGVENMVTGAKRIAGVQRLNTARRKHESMEQRTLQKDVATIEKCEEEWWKAGTLSELEQAGKGVRMAGNAIRARLERQGLRA